MSRVITNVYIDGMNLFYGCLKGSPYNWLDPVALSKSLVPNDEINTVHYFTAQVISTPRKPHAYIRQFIYLRALSTLPEVRIHLGYYRRDRVRMAVANPPPSTIEVLKTEEKGSDVNLATELLCDAFDQACQKQLVITNDSDLAGPIERVRQRFRMPVGIVNPGAGSRRTPRLSGDFYRSIRPGALAASQLPAVLKDAAGPITKPLQW
jgi:hypothetical protein